MRLANGPSPIPCERGREVALGRCHFLPPPDAVASAFFFSSAAGWVVSQCQPYIRVRVCVCVCVCVGVGGVSGWVEMVVLRIARYPPRGQSAATVSSTYECVCV